MVWRITRNPRRGEQVFKRSAVDLSIKTVVSAVLNFKSLDGVGSVGGMPPKNAIGKPQK